MRHIAAQTRALAMVDPKYGLVTEYG